MFFGKTARAINNQARATREVAEELEEDNEIKRERLEQEQKQFEEVQRTKDRADVSLNDYMALVEENKKLKEDVARLNRTIMKIIKPLSDYREDSKLNRIPDEIIDKIINGEFEIEVSVFEDVLALESRIGVIYKVDTRDLMGK